MRKSTKLILYGIPTTLLLSCAGGLLGFAHKSRTDRDLAVARLAEVGLLTDYVPAKPTPDTPKGAELVVNKFVRAFQNARRTRVGAAFFRDQEMDVRSAKEFITANAHLVRLRHQLFCQPEVSTLIRSWLDTEEAFNEYELFNYAVKLSSAEVLVLEADGKSAEAVKLAGQTAQFIKLLQATPNHSTETQHFYLQQATNRLAVQSFARNADRADVRAAMRGYANSSILTTDHRNALIGDVSDALQFEATVRQGKMELGNLSSSADPSSYSIGERAMLNLFKVNGAPEMLFARLFNGYAELYESIPSDRSQHKNRIAAVARWNKSISDISAPNSYLLQRLVASFTDCFEFEANLVAEWRTINALLIATEIKSKTGKYPISLPVTGHDAIDPFTDKPLKYLLKGGKLTIYSVGQDLSDDNGLLFRPTTSSSGGSSSWAQDTGFSIPYDVPARLR
ncbi:hypothetical protein MCEMSE15_01790 [Fimbriimonadaceae bacterium]